MINMEKIEEFKRNARVLYDSLDNKDVNALVFFTNTKVSEKDIDELSKMLTEEFGKPMYMVFMEPFSKFANRTISFGRIPDGESKPTDLVGDKFYIVRDNKYHLCGLREVSIGEPEMRKIILNFIKSPKDLICHIGAHNTFYNPENQTIELEVQKDKLIIKPYHDYLAEGEVYEPKSKKDKLLTFVNELFEQKKKDLETIPDFEIKEKKSKKEIKLEKDLIELLKEEIK